MIFGVLLFVRPARTYSNGCKSLMRPNSGNHTAHDKGVHRELESEESRRQISDLTHRNLIIRLMEVGESAKQSPIAIWNFQSKSSRYKIERIRP